MSPSPDPRRVRRVLVAVDASPHSLAALRAAVDLASALRLELLALFVEDLRLLHATELPFAREVATFSGAAHPLDLAQTERRLRDLARRVEAQVAATAAAAAVPWTFQVRRGKVVAEILADAGPGDVLSLGTAGWSPLRSRALGETTGQVLRLARGPVLLARHGTRLRLPLLVLLESDSWRSTLATAVSLTGPARDALVLAIAPGREQTTREDQAQRLLASLGAPPSRVRLLAGAGPAALRATARREGVGALVLPANASALQGPAGEQLLADADVPVVIVRPSDDEETAATAASYPHEKSPLG